MRALDDREVKRQVMALEAPAPRTARDRLAENRDVIERGIAAAGGVSCSSSLSTSSSERIASALA